MTLLEIKENLREIPAESGVYRIYWRGGRPPIFTQTTGGKRNDPTAEEVLTSKWVKKENLIYIGKANILRRRMHDLLRYGRNLADNHRGGRYIWQIKDVWRHATIEWEACNNPRDREKELLRAFEESHEGRLPFANLRH